MGVISYVFVETRSRAQIREKERKSIKWIWLQIFIQRSENSEKNEDI